MKFPVIELVDRYAIAVVKHSMTAGANTEEFKFYFEQLQTAGIDHAHELITELVRHHEYVWSMEDQFKKGQIDSRPLEEIARLALAIRDQGHERVRIKNSLAELFDDPVREIKNYGEAQ
jgi:hypothetical protein